MKGRIELISRPDEALYGKCAEGNLRVTEFINGKNVELCLADSRSLNAQRFELFPVKALK